MKPILIRPRPDIIFYHGPECYDGHTAAWILWMQFPHATFIPFNYGDGDPPDVSGRNVVVVDFSWKREIMIEMERQARSIQVLDHHKTAESELRGLHFAEFNMNKSGCRMAWDWLYPFEEPPWLVDHVEDRDLWRMVLPHTPFVHAYYTSIPMTFTDWSAMSERNFDNVVANGSAIMQSINRYCEKVGKHREFYLLPGEELAVTVNVPYLNASEMADYLLNKYTEAQLSVGWFRRRDGMFQYSLRSRSGYDVSEIARAYGGGGHAQAAGFESDLPPFSMPEWRLQ